MSANPRFTLANTHYKNNNLVQRFEYASAHMPVAMTYNSQKYYLHYDQVGSLRAVSDTSHNIVKEITYDTFGSILTDTNPSFKVPFGFAGGLYDTDTKLTRFGYRDYDAYTGKWTAKDPIGFAGGDSNLYGYVLGDPVNFVDPMGLYKHYGNWCGPNWTGGYTKPWDQLSPYEQGHTLPPVDPLDNCCKKHDKCYAKCRKNNKCDDDIKECQRRCDQKLCRCSLRTKGNKYGIPQYMCISGGI